MGQEIIITEKTRLAVRHIIFHMRRENFLSLNQSMLFILMILTKKLRRIMADGLSLTTLTVGRMRQAQVLELLFISLQGPLLEQQVALQVHIRIMMVLA